MFLKTLAVSAMVAAFSTGAFAQTKSDGDQMSGQTSIPSQWIGPIGEAFYTDGTGMALRSEAEAKANFAALSPELQTQVRNDCTSMAGATNTTTTAATGTGTSANASGDAEASQKATASQICDWVVGQ